MKKQIQCSIGKTVLFQNNKYSIETYMNANESFSIVVVKDKIYTDWPIMYTNGKVAFDRPEQLPNYIKEKVRKFYPKIRNL